MDDQAALLASKRSSLSTSSSMDGGALRCSWIGPQLRASSRPGA